jgi:pilus assembly protein Flp/PilA
MLSFEFVVAALVSRCCRSDRGASLVEYALLVALVAIACIAAVTWMGQAISNKFSSVGSGIGG